MERLQRDALLVTLIEHLQQQGSWCGETHIQKTAYFLQDLMAVPLGFDFILYKHGPYSFDLTSELTQMRADGIVSLLPQPPYGASYRPGRTSEVVKNLYPKTIQKYTRQINFIAQRLGAGNVASLERLATALFVTLRGKEAGVKARAQRISQLKPHIPVGEALDAVQRVDGIRHDSQAILG
ncbi:MAG TPA: hypothetical protein VMT20_28440 [Terriglobia bacterium]|nr:hypothetical protein [Terriglobia bacterium]